jgi:hypothetical protein
VITDYIMKDAEHLPVSLDNIEADVWAGYIGGAAANIWTDDDWRRVSHKPKLPIYVTRPDKTGKYCGLECIMALYTLGIPRGTAVAADLELLSSDVPLMNEWLEDFYRVLSFFGYEVWKYGSLDYLFNVDGVDGSWLATNSKVEKQYAHAGQHATQWLFGSDNGQTDSSLIHRWAVHHHLSANWGVNG